MQTLDTSRLTPQERRSYESGMSIVKGRLHLARLGKPSPEMIHEKSLREGKTQVARKLAAASTARTLTTSTPTPSAPALISAEVFKDVCRAATAAARKAAKSYARSAKPAEQTNHFLTRHRIFCPGGFTGAKLNGRILG